LFQNFGSENSAKSTFSTELKVQRKQRLFKHHRRLVISIKSHWLGTSVSSHGSGYPLVDISAWQLSLFSPHSRKHIRLDQVHDEDTPRFSINLPHILKKCRGD